MLSVKMHQTKAISWNQAKSGDDALLENVLEQSSKLSLIYEALKTRPQMRRKVHQVKEELFQEFSKENGKDNDELVEFAARFDRQDAAVQLQQDTRSLGSQKCRGCQKWFGGHDAWGTLRLPGNTDPAWRTSGDDAPVEGDQKDGSTKKWPRQRTWLMAPHQWKWPLNAYPAENQDPEADGGPDDKFSLAPTDPEAPPMSVGCAQQNMPTEAERLAQGWCERSCVRGRSSCVRGRGRDDPHRRQQDQMRDTQYKSFSATILLQRGEGGHHMQES